MWFDKILKISKPFNFIFWTFNLMQSINFIIFYFLMLNPNKNKEKYENTHII